MLRDMFFTLAGWLMFLLGVIFSGTVRGLWSGVRGKVSGAAPAGG
jgi:hypothetical protein